MAICGNCGHARPLTEEEDRIILWQQVEELTGCADSRSVLARALMDLRKGGDG